jgi:hypothetical protein
MATMIRGQATEVRGFADNAGYSRRKQWDIGLSQLIDELVIAVFVAMAVMWAVTTIAGIFG